VKQVKDIYRVIDGMQQVWC